MGIPLLPASRAATGAGARRDAVFALGRRRVVSVRFVAAAVLAGSVLALPVLGARVPAAFLARREIGGRRLLVGVPGFKEHYHEQLDKGERGGYARSTMLRLMYWPDPSH